MDVLIHYQLWYQYKQIERLIRERPIEFIEKRHRPAKWSITENLAHLGRYQEIFNQRIDRVLKEDQPFFKQYKPEADPLFKPWLGLSTEEVIRRTKKDREAIGRRFMAMSISKRKRIGHHPVLGALTLMDWLQFFLLHESHHYYTIFKMVQEFKP